MNKFVLTRHAETPRSTWGELEVQTWNPGAEEGEPDVMVDRVILCKTLERGLSNPDGHPRIPAGTYKVIHKPFGSSHFDAALQAFPIPNYQGILWLPEVPGRQNIEIHTANFVEQLLGCICTGESISTDDKGDYCTYESKAAYAKAYPQIIAEIGAHQFASLTITDPPAGA